MFVNRVTTTVNVAAHQNVQKQRKFGEVAEASAYSVEKKAEAKWRERLSENVRTDADCNSPSSLSSQYDLNLNPNQNQNQTVNNMQSKSKQAQPASHGHATKKSSVSVSQSHSSSNLVLNQSRQFLELSNSMDQLNLRTSAKRQIPEALKQSTGSLALPIGIGPHNVNVNVTSIRNYQPATSLASGSGSYAQKQRNAHMPIEISLSPPRYAMASKSTGSPVPRLRIFVPDGDDNRNRNRNSLGRNPGYDKDNDNDNYTYNDKDESDIQPGFVKQRLEELRQQPDRDRPHAAASLPLSAMHTVAKSARPSAFRPVMGCRQLDNALARSPTVSRTSTSYAYSTSPHLQVHPNPTVSAAGSGATAASASLRRSYDPLFTVSSSNNQLNPNALQARPAPNDVSGTISHCARPPTKIQSLYAAQSGGAITNSNSSEYAQLLSPSRHGQGIGMTAYSHSASNVTSVTPISSGQSTVCATPTHHFDRAHLHQAGATREVCGSGVSSIDSGVVTELTQSRASLHHMDQKNYYENLIREKNLELQHLRSTMEQNEEAMTRVFEARKHEWFGEYEMLRNEAERRIALERERCNQLEQQVQFLNAQMEQAQATIGSATRLAQQVQEMDHTNRNFAQQLENFKWTLHQKQGELSMLRTQCKDNQNETQSARQHVKQLECDNAQLLNERSLMENKISTLETAMKELAENLEHVTRELLHIQQSKGVPARVEVVTQTETECEPEDSRAPAHAVQQIAFLENTIHCREVEFENERRQWQEEKTKVISYQKQLQLNYLQMSQRNKRLESELQMLQMKSDVIIPP